MLKKFIFWNLKKNELSTVIRDLIGEHNIDFFVALEIKEEDKDLVENLINQSFAPLVYRRIQTSSDCLILCKDNFPNIVEVRSTYDSRYSILKTAISSEDYLFVIAHLPSKLYKSEDEQNNYSMELIKEINETETSFGIENTILFGDLNMNPFEKGIVNVFGLNSVRCSKIASSVKTVRGGGKKFFYNPSWKLLLSSSGESTGSYYHGMKEFTHYWHVFDQVLFRSVLQGKFKYDSFKVINKTLNISFLTRGGIPNKRISDHLPVFFEFDL